MFVTIINLITKKTFLGVFFSVCFFFLFISSFVNTHSAHAQTVSGNSSPSVSAPQAGAAKPAENAAAKKDGAGVSGTEVTGFGMRVFKSIGSWVGNQILSLTALLTYLGGMALDYTLNHFVFEMGKYVNSPGLGSAIDATWKLVRDIANLIFIFAFVYVGIYLIIDPEKSSIKGMLARTILGAILINFSLFFVKFIIDFANFTSLQIYSSLTTGTGNLSNTIAGMLGITGFFRSPDPEAFANITGGDAIWFFILSGLLLLIVAFVFFVGAFMMLIRFVGLIMIMVASPILFAGTIFPGTQDIASDLWKKLISYAFYAPAFLLIILISIILIEPLMKMEQSGMGLGDILSGKVTEGSMDTFGIFMNFFIVIFFFIQALHLADKMGLKGGEMTVNIAHNIRGKAQSFIGRNTAGRAGEWMQKSIAADRESNSRVDRASGAIRNFAFGGVAGAAASAKFGGTQSRTDAKKETETLNRARAVNAQVDTISKHVSVGHPSTATPQQKIDMERSIAGASTEQLQELLKRHKVGTPEHSAIIQNMSSAQFDSLMKLKPEDLDDTKKAELKTTRSNVMQAKHGINQPATPGGAATVDPGDIAKADAKDLEALGFDTLLQHAGYLSSKQLDDLKSLGTTAHKTLKDARNKAITDDFTASGPVHIFARFKNDTDRSKLPAGVLTDPSVAQYLSLNVLSKIPDTEGLTSTEMLDVKNNVLGHHHGTPDFTKYDNFFKKSNAGNRFG